MSNTQRYVRILPSAVESKYRGWGEDSVGLVYMVLGEEHGYLRLAYAPNRIENRHIKEVYVYDEPRELPTAKPMKVRVVKAGKGSWYETQVGEEFNVLEERKSDYIVEKVGDTWYHIDKEDCEIVTEPERIAELEARVAKLESHVGGLMMIVDRLEDMHGIGRTLMEHGSDEQPATHTESNLDKAKRLYPKGTRFKSAYLEGEYVSSGEIREATAKDGNIVCIINKRAAFLFCDGQWAEIVQDEPAEVNTWELTIDIPEWGLKKGQHSEYISNNMAKFSWQDYTASIPVSIMPHVAKAVG